MRCRQGLRGGCAQHDAVEERQLHRRGEQCVGVSPLPRHHDLGAAQAQIERVEQRHMREQVFLRAGENAVEQTIRLFAKAVLSAEHGEPEQVLRGDGIRIGRGVVGGGCGPHDEALGVIGRQKVATGRRIGVVGIEGALPRQRALQVGPLPGRFVECERGADHGGEIRG